MFKSLVVLLSMSFLIWGCKEQGTSFSGSAKKKQPKPAVQEQPDPLPDLGNPTDNDSDPILDDPDPVDDDLVIDDAPSNAVIAGSFRAWTVPEDPTPGQTYKIIIEVKLPKNIDNYTKDDLTGLVIGTDGYRQPIGRGQPDGLSQVGGDDNLLGDLLGIDTSNLSFGEEFSYTSGKARLGVTVPGAAQLVEDTIDIKSDILDEEQTLKIIF